MMDGFTIDLDKVLDEFEESEGNFLLLSVLDISYQPRR